MRYFLLGLLLTFSTFVHATCEDHYAAGPPITNQNTTKLCRIGYVVEHLNSCKAPLLVMEQLLPANLGGTEPRDVFKQDPNLPVRERSTLKDYAKSGYDIGHMAPAGDFSTNSATMKQSFYLSNAVPQVRNLNRGQWKSLEIRVRGLAMKQQGIFVYTGAVFGPNRIGNGVCVPSHMYKIVIDTKLNQTVAYLIPNVEGIKDYKRYATTVEEIEKFTGINFLPDMIPLAKKFVGPALFKR